MPDLIERLVRRGTPERVESAVALYQGPLLDGVHVAAPAFEEWLDVERARRLAHELGLTLEAGVRDTTPSNTPS